MDTEEYALQLYHFADRHDARLPDFFLPRAPGVIVADADFLCAIELPLTPDHPTGWSTVDVNRWQSHDRELEVAKLGRYWFIGRRTDRYALITETVVEPFGRAPIGACSSNGAIMIAEHCHPKVRLPIGAQWIRF